MFTVAMLRVQLSNFSEKEQINEKVIDTNHWSYRIIDDHWKHADQSL